MKNIIIVSKCLRVTKINVIESIYEFHFKGVYSGKMISKVRLKSDPCLNIHKNFEYILYVELTSIKENILNGSILKCKLVDECWDQS